MTTGSHRLPATGHRRGMMDSMMDEKATALLDNPIWSALTTDHAPLALGSDRARRYPDHIGPLSGMPAQSPEGYEALAPLFSPGEVAVLFFREPPRVPEGWTLVRGAKGIQMVAPEPQMMSCADPAEVQLRKLTSADAPAMVDLAKLTEPGPFRLCTLELGTFFGILQSARLLAMAGKRMHLPGFVEVSGVCTHPDARGRGFARLLMSCVMAEIVAAGKTPILHTYAENYNAIRLYETLGFRLRQTFDIAAVKKESR
jgi:ribosomal protein S18 acetylase RimI-like enzyme